MNGDKSSKLKKPSKGLTKMRVVYNYSSQKDAHSSSLNNNLEVGPLFEFMKWIEIHNN